MPAKNRKKAFSAVDLFAGCGGLTQGLKKAGFRVLGAVDNDALSIESYTANHPEVKTWQLDIRKLAASKMMRGLHLRRGQLDLLAGCPPCQGFSAMRTLNGAKRSRDARNNLVFDFLRFIRVLRPKSVMLENVPRFAKDRRIAQFKRELRRLGYRYKCEVLNAADYGVPQRRRRMIVVASRAFEPFFAKPSTSRRTVRNAIANLTHPNAGRDQLHRSNANRSPRIMAMIRGIPRNGGSRNSLGRGKQLECHRKCDGFKDVYGRMAWNKVAPTITGGCINPSKGRFLHPSQNRAITLREAALLQSFPKSYRISLRRGRYPAAALIGNALPPEFVRRHAVRLLRSLGSSRVKKRTD
jgi:DNA (cytosine-5)-methyltransferase 1